MSVWRRKAIECLPGLRTEFEQPDTSIYGVFFEVLPALVQAHKENDTKTINNIYSFAEWCLKNSDNDISNAAAVAFYEHLGNYPETFAVMHLWVNLNIYKQMRPLIELQITSSDLQILDENYGLKSNKKRKK